MNVTALVQSVSNAIGHLTAAVSDELVGFAKGNITEHIASLLSVPHNASVVEAVDLLADYVNLPGNAANAAGHCVSSALGNLSRIENISSKNPLDYVPSTCEGIKHCLAEEAAKQQIDEWLLILLLTLFIMTVLFGPFWPILVPLRMMGFGAIGVTAGSVAAKLQSVLYGGYTPPGGRFAKFTRWGMSWFEGLWGSIWHALTGF